MDPLIRLVPIMKLTGNLIVSFPKKLTFTLFELFCIPRINIENKYVLKIIVKINFFNGNNIQKRLVTYQY